MIKIEWKNSCNLGGVVFTTGWGNVFFLKSVADGPAIIGEPQYQEEKEESVDGYGRKITAFQRNTKLHKLDFVAPEYVVDAFIDLPMHSDITITDMDKGIVHQVESITVTPDWIGCQAVITLLFSSCVSLYKTSCGCQ